LRVEIEVAQPLRGFDMKSFKFNDSNQDLFCEWAVAVGLSLKGWNGGSGEKEAAQTKDSAYVSSDNDERN